MKLLQFIGFLISFSAKMLAIPLGYLALMVLVVSGLRHSYLYQQIKFTLNNIWNVKWWLIEKERSKHIQLIGATGAGKTTALQYLIDRSIKAGTGFLLIDSRGSLPDRVLSNKQFSLTNSKKLHEKLVYLDFENNPPAFNILNLPLNGRVQEKQTQAEVLAEELCQALATNMRPEPNQAQKNLLKNLLVVGIYSTDATMLSLLHWIGNTENERQAEIYTILDSIPSEPLKRYFNEDFRSGLLAKTKEALRNRLSSLITPHQLYKSLCAKQCSLDFAGILAQNKFVIVKASTAILGNYPARTISNIVLSLLYFQGFKRIASGDTPMPFHVYIDELEYFANESLIQSLKSARQTGLSYCLSYQEMNQAGIYPSLQKTINREAAVKIIGQLRADEQKAAIGLVGLSDKKAFENLKAGRFWVKAGSFHPFEISFPSRFAVPKTKFGSWWTGRAFMSRKEKLQLLKHIQSQNNELNYQWPSKSHETSKQTLSNFSPHGIPFQ